MGREGLLINERIKAFSYLVEFMSTFALPMCDTRGMEALQRLQPLRVKLERLITQVQLLSPEVGGGDETDDFQESGSVCQRRCRGLVRRRDVEGCAS